MSPEAIKEWKAKTRSDPEAYKVLLDWALENGEVKPAHSREALQARFEAFLSEECLWIISYEINLGNVVFGPRLGIVACNETHAKEKFEEMETLLVRKITSIVKDENWSPPLTYTPIERRGWLE